MFRAKPPVVVPEVSTEGRIVSVVAGLILAAAAVKPRPNRLLSVLALATGSYLAYRGATGHCPLTKAVHDHCPEWESRGR
ncbi:DUF2892 domain-containing protein [Kaistia defluvii]|jgi:uncharacterized membrane protein|uniref:YgaP family membrane protein n=1 Tax=Kaistia defluvii TaxID=410841 RepID=UPI00225A1822|nr:DUF2892 domain-containing protein [Kaistia defluvii]MCX5517110.1 DUF2892 domain-containing protein [Kaistia defluvii]